MNEYLEGWKGFGVAYRHAKTAWKIAPYPLRSTPEGAQKLIEWLQSNSQFKAWEMQVVSVAMLPKAVNNLRVDAQ